MRVVSGIARGKKLIAVPGDNTRPILDRVKTALFDTIRHTLPGLSVLDLFAGSGSVGIEALSQGAAHCTFIDAFPKAIDTIKENLESTGFVNQAEVRNQDAFTFLRNTRKSFDLIYVAPPQYKNIWVEAMHFLAERPQILNPAGQIIVQIDPKEYEILGLSDFVETRQKKYGNTLLVFYAKNSN